MPPPPTDDAAIEAELEATRAKIEALRSDLGGERQGKLRFANVVRTVPAKRRNRVSTHTCADGVMPKIHPRHGEGC